MCPSPIPQVIVGDETISSVEDDIIDDDIEDNSFDEEECGDDDEYDLDGYNSQSGGSLGDKYMSFRIYIIDRGFKYIDSGSFRATYIRNGVVIKVPRNFDGEVDNMVEAAAWHKYKNNPTSQGIYLAPCRLLSNGCLMMMTVDLSQDYEFSIYTKWIDDVEGYQVGIYRSRLVAYDYALDIPERIKWEEEWGVSSETYQLSYRCYHEAFYKESEDEESNG